MLYPKNGSVVVVDDKIEEVGGILRALTREGVPVYYLNGEPDEIPEIDEIKLLFLDLDLNVAGNDKQKIAKLMLILRKLINEKSSDYILIAWSSLVQNLYLLLLKEIAKDLRGGKHFIRKRPLSVMNFTKQEVSAQGEANLELIKNRLDTIIKKQSIKNLYILWENIVLSASKKVIKNLESLTKNENDAKDLIGAFANATAHLHYVKSTTKDAITNGILPLSNLLIDQVNSELAQQTINEEIALLANDLLTSALKIDRTKLPIKTVSTINSFYHIDLFPTDVTMPGNIFLYEKYMDKLNQSENCTVKWAIGLTEKVLQKIEIPEGKIKKAFNQISLVDLERRFLMTNFDSLVRENKDLHYNSYAELTKEKDKKDILRPLYIAEEKERYLNRLKLKTIPFFMEISPDCDFVQGKRKKMRMIFGLLLPYNFEKILEGEKKDSIKIIGENILNNLLVEYENINYQVILDLHTVTAINFDAFEGITPAFRFRKEFVVDVQHKVASHFSRPGFFNMGDYS